MLTHPWLQRNNYRLEKKEKIYLFRKIYMVEKRKNITYQERGDTMFYIRDPGDPPLPPWRPDDTILDPGDPPDDPWE